MQVVDPSVVEDGESRAEFMALLKYLTQPRAARRVREMRVAIPSRVRNAEEGATASTSTSVRKRACVHVRVRYFHMMHRSCRGRSHSRTFMYPISLGHFPNHQTLGGSALPLLLLGETIQRDFDEYHVEP